MSDSHTAPALHNCVMVNGDSIALDQLVAIAESLEQERPNLFALLKSFHSSPEEMNQFFRQMIRDDYDNHAREVAARAPSAPLAQEEEEREKGGGEEAWQSVSVFVGISENLPPPDAARSKSLQESMELAARLEAEEAAQEEAAVQQLVGRLEEQDREEAEQARQRARLFYCEICMDHEAAIHGAITLDCDHRFCEGVCVLLCLCATSHCSVAVAIPRPRCPAPCDACMSVYLSICLKVCYIIFDPYLISFVLLVFRLSQQLHLQQDRRPRGERGGPAVPPRGLPLPHQPRHHPRLHRGAGQGRGVREVPDLRHGPVPAGRHRGGGGSALPSGHLQLRVPVAARGSQLRLQVREVRQRVLPELLPGGGRRGGRVRHRARPRPAELRAAEGEDGSGGGDPAAVRGVEADERQRHGPVRPDGAGQWMET